MAPKPRLAGSLARLEDECRVRYRARRKDVRPAQNAWLGDASHRARKSGHNPDERGVVHAKDYDVRGMNVETFLNRVIGDPRVWYVIYKRRIWSSRHDWKPQAYTGADPHIEHVHVSLWNNQETNTFDRRVIYAAEKRLPGWGLAHLLNPKVLVHAAARISKKTTGRVTHS